MSSNRAYEGGTDEETPVFKRSVFDILADHLGTTLCHFSFHDAVARERNGDERGRNDPMYDMYDMYGEVRNRLHVVQETGQVASFHRCQPMR